MEENQKKPELYTLPFKIHSRYSFGMHIVFMFLITMFIGFSFIPVHDLGGIFVRVFSLILGLFFLYPWIYIGVLKKGFLEVTEEGITFKTIFKSKKLLWSEVIDVRTFYMSNNTYIGLISKEKVKKRKNNFLTLLSDGLGGQFSLSIPIKTFKGVDPEKLYATIFYTVKEKLQEKVNDVDIDEKETESLNIDNSENVEAKKTNNVFLAIVKSFIVAIFSGSIYGLTIYLFKVNFLLIPILTTIVILFTYFKNYNEKRFNIIYRFFLGIFCILQIYIALLISLLMLNSQIVKYLGYWNSIIDCSNYIFTHPGELIRFYIIGIICFFIGVFSGYSSRTTRTFNKMFMKKQNGFYIKREKRYITIYLIDYADYDENAEKIAIEINPNVCMIEKDKKKILAFYMPEEIMKEFEIDQKIFQKIYSDEKEYFKLDLGGRSEKEVYGYSSIIILNKNKEVELIQLEID